MFGGITVAGNLLCISYSDVRGKLFLIDLEEKRLASHWSYAAADGGYADAGGVAMDAAYNIFVADTGNDTVRRFTPFGRDVGRLGRSPERGPGAAHRDRVGVLDRPHAVAICGDVVFVACGERKLVRGVQRFHRDGRVMAPLRSFGESEGRFGAPRGLCATPDGVFVADTLHGVIQRFRVHGPFISQFPTAVHHDEASRPFAVQLLRGGELLVADHGDVAELKRFSIEGRPLPLALDPALELREPVDLARDAQDRIYVLDRDGERVQRLLPDLGYDGVVVDLAEVGFGE